MRENIEELRARMNSWSSENSLFDMTSGPTKEERMLADAESRDSYRRECMTDPANRAARVHMQYVPHSGQPATTFLQVLPRWLHGVADKSYIIWMHPSADGGLPHTRPGSLVCMPMNWPKESLAGTLAHELVHCWQRQTPAAWKTLYERLGWRLARDEEIERIPVDYLNRIRINPDTLLSGPFWVWREQYIPLALFQRLDKPSLKETDVRWFDLGNSYAYRSPPREFQEYFGPVNDPEHPAEVAAYTLADPETFQKYPAWQVFRSFAGL